MSKPKEGFHKHERAETPMDRSRIRTIRTCQSNHPHQIIRQRLNNRQPYDPAKPKEHPKNDKGLRYQPNIYMQ